MRHFVRINNCENPKISKFGFKAILILNYKKLYPHQVINNYNYVPKRKRMQWLRGVHGLGKPKKTRQTYSKKPKKVGWVGRLSEYGFKK